MNRVGEYIRFVMWFMGLGYAVLWPFTAYDGLGVRLQLSPGLHLVGMLAASGVAICLLLRPLRRWRRSREPGAAASAPSAQPAVHLRLLRKPPPPPRRYVRPRTHFGLRNAPH